MQHQLKKAVTIVITLLASLGLHGNAEAIPEISYNDFSSTSGYALLGSAQKVGSTLQLVPSMQNVVGGVFFNTPVDISSFSASFSFTFSNPGAGDGMVFVIKKQGSNGTYTNGLGFTGEAIGYADRYGWKGINNSVGVEFDSHTNDTPGVTNDTNNDNHIAIDTNASVLSLTQVAVKPDFNSANPWYAWVDYNGKTISVSVNQTGTKPATAMLSYGTTGTPFLISDYVGPSTGLVGFTASTGGAFQTTTLRSFSYDSAPTPESPTWALLATGALIAGIAARKKGKDRSINRCLRNISLY
jgi:hypothetical protein